MVPFVELLGSVAELMVFEVAETAEFGSSADVVKDDDVEMVCCCRC